MKDMLALDVYDKPNTQLFSFLSILVVKMWWITLKVTFETTNIY